MQTNIGKNNYENKNTGKRPEKQFSSGALRATVWKNEGTSNTGEPTFFSTVTFERSYKDKSGDWKTTSTLRINDLPRASLILDKAYEYLAFSEN